MSMWIFVPLIIFYAVVITIEVAIALDADWLYDLCDWLGL